MLTNWLVHHQWNFGWKILSRCGGKRFHPLQWPSYELMTHNMTIIPWFCCLSDCCPFFWWVGIPNFAVVKRMQSSQNYGTPVHAPDRSFHALVRSFHALDRSFHGLSTVLSEVICFSVLFLQSLSVLNITAEFGPLGFSNFLDLTQVRMLPTKWLWSLHDGRTSVLD